MSILFLLPTHLGTFCFCLKKKEVNLEAACNCQKNVKLGATQAWIHIPTLAHTSYGTLGKTPGLCLTSLNFSFLPCRMSITPSVLCC